MATLKKKWDWSLILAGILLLACGLLCCFAPNLTLATIAMIAGVGFLLSGVLGIVFYVRFRSMMSVSGWSLAYAILDVLIGLMFVLHPLVGGAAISWLVALCFLVFGLFEIFAAMKSKSIGFSAWGIGLFSGIVNIVCAIMLFVSPILFSLLVAFIARRTARQVRRQVCGQAADGCAPGFQAGGPVSRGGFLGISSC